MLFPTSLEKSSKSQFPSLEPFSEGKEKEPMRFRGFNVFIDLGNLRRLTRKLGSDIAFLTRLWYVMRVNRGLHWIPDFSLCELATRPWVGRICMGQC